MDDTHFPDRVARISIEVFNSLPKTGKPITNEWTVLSCIIKEENNSLDVVALGTGSKCIGKSKMSPKGDILNDSHAEVICRRAFILYLYEQMDYSLNSEKSILTFDRESLKFHIDSDIKFHFFTTLMPCGDASIFPKSDFNNTGNAVVKIDSESKDYRKKRSADVDQSFCKKLRMDDGDIHRTGAKCLGTHKLQDPKGQGADYHVTGVVRTKPGRGDPTLSVSCSDKIMKWCRLGLQGAFLSLLLDKPIYLSSFTVVGHTPFSRESLQRAFFDRLSTYQPLFTNQMKFVFHQAEGVKFDFQKTEGREVCPSSIFWFKSEQNRKSEIAVEGKKQGVTKRNKNSDSSKLKICKAEMFKKFKSLYNSVCSNIDHLKYIECKEKAEDYQLNWNHLKCYLGVWPEKNSTLLEFY